LRALSHNTNIPSTIISHYFVCLFSLARGARTRQTRFTFQIPLIERAMLTRSFKPMQTKLLALLSVVAWGAVQTVTANDIEPGKEYYTVQYAPKPIVLDGDLSEWSGVPVIADP